MQIEGIRSAADLNTTQAAGESDSLGKNQFLELMIAQMNNQDPLEPAKNEDFVAQLAQFSTVEGIENMNKALVDMARSMQSSLTLEASSLVGRSVMVPTNQTFMGSDGLVGTIDIPESTGNVMVEISNSNGELVKRIDLGPRAAGPLRFGWDGTGNTGEPLPQGIYRVNAYNEAGGGRREFGVNLPERVVSVSISESGAIANLASGTSIPTSQIKEIQ